MITDKEAELRDAYLQGYEDRATYSRKMVVDRYELAEKYAKKQAKNNEVLDLVIWRCIKPITDVCQNEIFTKGRLYEQVDGWIIDNNGDKTELSIFEEYFTSI